MELEILMGVLELHIYLEILTNQCQKFKEANILEPGCEFYGYSLTQEVIINCILDILPCTQIFWNVPGSEE